MINLKERGHSSGNGREDSGIPSLEYKSESRGLRFFEYNEESDCDMYNYFAKHTNITFRDK